MKNIFLKIICDLHTKFYKLEKERKKDKIDLSINKTKILTKNKSNRGNSFSKTNINFYDSNEKEKNNKFIEIIKIYKIKIENYKYKIEEMKSQLEDLKEYSNTLEKTLEDKYINYFYDNKNYYKYKNLMKSIENLDRLNKQSTEDSSNKQILLKNNEQIIKQLNINNNDLQSKLKIYEKNIRNNNTKNNNFFNDLKIIQNICFSYEFQNNHNLNNKNVLLFLQNNLVEQKENEIIILNRKINEIDKDTNNSKILLNKKEKQMNNEQLELNNLNNKIGNINKEILSNKNINKILIVKEIEFEIERQRKHIKFDSINKINLAKSNKSENKNINEPKNKDNIRQMNQDKLLLVSDTEKKNEIINKESSESQQKFDNRNSLSNLINNSLKESYNKKISKTQNDLIRKIRMLEIDLENKNKELEGLKNIIQKFQKDKENFILNYESNNSSNNSEIKLKKEIQKLKAKIEKLSSLFQKEVEELRNENEKLLKKYNNLKREKSINK